MKKNELLKKVRTKKGATQVELADKLGVKQSYIANLEKNYDFSYKQALKIAEALKVSVESFYVENDITNNSDAENTSKEQLIKELSAKIESLERLLAAKDEIITLLKKQRTNNFP